MKRILAVVPVLALMLVAGSASAAPITVNFGALGTNSVDIMALNNPSGQTLDGVNFLYEASVDTDFAFMDQNGVLGTTGGGLILGFDAPVAALWLDFFDLGLTAASDEFGLLAVFDNGEDMQLVGTFDPLSGAQFGQLAHVANSPFQSVSLYFPLQASLFSIDAVSYELAPTTAPVPEPATLLLTASGFLALARFTRRRR